MLEQTGDCYESFAIQYAETVDQKAIMLHYERPALISLLPDVQGIKALDAGCGTGWCSEYLLNHNAQVTAFDLNEEFVARTRSRLGTQANVLQANLAEPLTFLADETCDLIVSSLVMHYIKDWRKVFREFNRVLKAAGQLVFSTHHPFTDWKMFEQLNYFSCDLLEDRWDVGKVRFFRRPLSAMSEGLEATGFVIDRILEPRPQKVLRDIEPELFQRSDHEPWRLMFRARKL